MLYKDDFNVCVKNVLDGGKNGIIDNSWSYLLMWGEIKRGKLSIDSGVWRIEWI